MTPSLVMYMMTNERRAQQLGMPYGTACARLRKALLFQMAQQLDKDVCVRCQESIDSIDDFTIEHIEPWYERDEALFWDLENIGFSHAKCNLPHRRSGPTAKHGQPMMYRRGCRCETCKEWKKADNEKYRSSKGM